MKSTIFLTGSILRDGVEILSNVTVRLNTPTVDSRGVFAAWSGSFDIPEEKIHGVLPDLYNNQRCDHSIRLKDGRQGKILLQNILGGSADAPHGEINFLGSGLLSKPSGE